MSVDRRVVAIVGPTAVGKTALSLDLAAHFDGEIVSADSRQIYRGMDIGTAKVTREERARVPHHMVDVVRPDESLTLAQYRDMATVALTAIWSRGRLPFLVGGTGLYVRALIEGWSVPEVPPNEALRQRLYAQSEREGAESLHRELRAIDPRAAEMMDARNVRRVVRALEVCIETGKRMSELQTREDPGYATLWLGLTMPRAQLYSRIDERVDRMLDAGLVDEVRALLDEGYSQDMPAMSGLGYRQIAKYLQGNCTLGEAVALIKRQTRRFVRQQYNWFRLDDARIHWLDASDDPQPQGEALVGRFLTEGCP